MNNIRAAWQMMDELVELTTKTERRVDFAELLLAEAQISGQRAVETAERLQELLNKLLVDDE